MLSVDTVLSLIPQKVGPAAEVEIPLSNALGQLLAYPLKMPEDSPRFDRSMLDGFAVRSSDARDGARLRLIGHVNAGDLPADRTLTPGECVGINTGAPVPPGADAILMVEHASLEESGPTTWVKVGKTVAANMGIQRRGSDATAGSVILSAGTLLTSRALAVCAAAGAARVPVRRVRAALLTTGDELVPPEQVPQGGQIRNSNHPMLAGLLQEHAFANVQEGTFLDLGSCGDQADELRRRLHRGLRNADLLVVSGGMSMGTRDLVPPLLKESGVEFLVEKVRMKPGKPFVLGRWPRPEGGVTIVAGLPGNPVSALVTFHRFVRPVIAQLQGRPPFDPLIEATTSHPLSPNGDREFYQPCRLSMHGPALVAEPLAWKGSADLFTLAKADGVLVRRVDAGAVDAGGAVTVLPFRQS